MRCASTRKLSQLPASDPLTVAGALLFLVSAVRDLGVFIHSDLGAAKYKRRYKMSKLRWFVLVK